MKDATDDEVRSIAVEAQQLCRKFNATFIIDDRVALVRELHADGVHLGKNDMPIAEARRLLGPDYIIGGTANTIYDVKSHYAAGADYIGCGPFRFTTTKQKLSPVLGLEGYKRIVIEMRAAHIDLPIVAIGGITKEDIPAILATGITGIALSGTVLRASNPIDEMKHLISIINHE
jgi:thiamine-phosphate pyrophosphorylase